MKKKVIGLLAGILSIGTFTFGCGSITEIADVPGMESEKTTPQSSMVNKSMLTIAAEEISTVTLTANPPGTSIKLNDKQIQELIGLLNQVVLYEKDDSYGEYNGQWVRYDIQKKDGTDVSLVAFNPFFIINSTGYQTEYEPCEAINAFANELLRNAAGEEQLDGEEEVISLKIVDGSEDGILILAGDCSADVYSLCVDDIPVYLDGELSDVSVLEDGMTAEISYHGSVEEVFPAVLGGVSAIHVYSRGTMENPGGTMYDLSGLYLQVLNDLWDTDEGLDDIITYVGVDLSEAPGDLTDGEKSAIAWIFAREHDLKMLTLSYEELEKQGYIKDLCWEDGILFRITKSDIGEGEFYSLPVIQFNAEKWRSGKGAYLFTDCQAVWPEMGTWGEYSIGSRK